MTQLPKAIILLFGFALAAGAQSLEDLNIQIHGYVTQAMVGTTANNWNTMETSSVSAAWTEAVVNVTSQPMPKLRVGAQGRYYQLGNYGNTVTLDWASGDYKVNERFGIRVGKVKTPMGLLNESQDIDPAFLWSLLPQAVYPIASRNSTLAHFGGVVYGTQRLGGRGGKLDYRAWGGELVLGSNDGYLQRYIDRGFTLPNGLSGQTYGAALRWNAPLQGLMVGASESHAEFSGAIQAPMPLGPGGSYIVVTGNANMPGRFFPYYFGRYEHGKTMVAAEYTRLNVAGTLTFPVAGVFPQRANAKAFYGMASYKLSGKLTAGAYYCYSLDHQQTQPAPGRFLRDYTVSGRYDFSSFIYAKAEQHITSGTLVGYSSLDNPNGLKTDTKMTIVKVGVSF
jgi:hypothetical protein